MTAPVGSATEACRPRQRHSHLRTITWVAVIAGLAAAARIPFLLRPLGPDEGGFLLVASQWTSGRSLYGDYWVDRPPLLIDFFHLADALGGALPLRLLGIGLVVTSVVLAAGVGGVTRGATKLCAATAAVFLVNPLLGVHEIDGELIAVPLILASCLGALLSWRSATSGGRAGWLMVSGACGVAAVLVKQNELDGLVLLLVGSVTFLRHRQAVWRTLVPAALGGLLLAVLVLAHAASRGTSASGLLDAVVTFRFDASAVLKSSASSATGDRFRTLVLSLVLAGAPLIVLRFLMRLRDKPRSGAPDLRHAVLAVLAWETFSVLGGGSYWLHYLIGLVPGLVLAIATLTSSATAERRPVPRLMIAYAVTACLVAMTTLLARPDLNREDPVITWLQAHASSGDTAVVAYGHADYLAATGLTSPYSELWSLPVRVRDPDLTALTDVLRGPARPDWIITGATGSLQSWGIDATLAQPVFNRRYRLVAELEDRRIYLEVTQELRTP